MLCLLGGRTWIKLRVRLASTSCLWLAHLSADNLLPWAYPWVDCRPYFVDSGRAASGAAWPRGRVGRRRRACERRAGQCGRSATCGGASAANALRAAAGGVRGRRSRRGTTRDSVGAGGLDPHRYETAKSRLKSNTDPMKQKQKSLVSLFLWNRSVVTFSKTEVFPDRITEPNYRFKLNAHSDF